MNDCVWEEKIKDCLPKKSVIDKPRREITLGEMQDECKRCLRCCEKCDQNIKEICDSISGDSHDTIVPMFWNLTDPPRFNEAQMAGLNDLYAIGARIIETQIGISLIWKSKNKDRDDFIGTVVSRAFGLEDVKNETLDLAELLGKDGAE